MRLSRLIVLALLLFPAALFAQLENSLSFGGGPTYTLLLDEPGLNARVYYNTGPHLCFGLEASRFRAHETWQGVFDYRTRIMDVNLNAHYVFHLSHKVGVYPVSGLNYTIENREVSRNEVLVETEDHSAFGFNLGGGTHAVFGNWIGFMEYQHVFSDLKDDIITLGVLYTISFGKQEEHSTEHH